MGKIEDEIEKCIKDINRTFVQNDKCLGRGLENKI